VVERINIGILGAAQIARRYLIPSIQSLPEQFNLLGVASRSIAKAKSTADQFNISAYQGYESLIELSELDAVYIPLPNSLHYQYVKLALEHNLHVLVEKPMACSLGEAEQLVALAKAKDLALVENFQFRFHKQLAVLQQVLAEDIGEIRNMRIAFGFPPFQDQDNIRYQKALGGGARLDAGAYTTKASQILLGQGLEVKAASLHYHDQCEVDIWGRAFLQQPGNGLFSTLSFGFDNHYQCGVEIIGSKARLYTNRLFTAPPGYEALFHLEQGANQTTINVPPDNHFINMLRHFHALITSGKDKNKEYEQNLDQARLVAEIEAISNGK
jgi:hypothetical protein